VQQTLDRPSAAPYTHLLEREGCPNGAVSLPEGSRGEHRIGLPHFCEHVLPQTKRRSPRRRRPTVLSSRGAGAAPSTASSQRGLGRRCGLLPVRTSSFTRRSRDVGTCWGSAVRTPTSRLQTGWRVGTDSRTRERILSPGKGRTEAAADAAFGRGAVERFGTRRARRLARRREAGRERCSRSRSSSGSQTRSSTRRTTSRRLAGRHGRVMQWLTTFRTRDRDDVHGLIYLAASATRQGTAARMHPQSLAKSAWFLVILSRICRRGSHCSAEQPFCSGAAPSSSVALP